MRLKGGLLFSSFRIFIILYLTLNGEARKRKRKFNERTRYNKHKIFFDAHYKAEKETTDKFAAPAPFTRETQLYSKASGAHVQIKGKKIDGNGKNGSKYARLVIESDSFGRIRIKSAESGKYICINKRGRLVGKRNGRRRRRCVFREFYADNGYTEFIFAENPSWYMGIQKNGKPKLASKTKTGTRAVQFIERPMVSRSLRTFVKKLRRRKQDLKLTLRSLINLQRKINNNQKDSIPPLSDRTTLVRLQVGSKILKKLVAQLRREEMREARRKKRKAKVKGSGR